MDLSKLLNKNYQTLYIVISTGKSKELLGKNMTTKELESMSEEEIDAYYKIYELNYADRINNHLIGTLYSLYSYAVNKILSIDDIEKLQEDLNNDYNLTTELKSLTAGLAASCSKIMALISLGIITLKHVNFNKDSKEHCEEQCEELCNEHHKELVKELET